MPKEFSSLQKCILYTWQALHISFYGLIAYNVWQGSSTLDVYLQLRHNLEIIQAHITQLEQETSELEMEIDKVTYSPEYAKKLLKYKYNILSPGEQVIYFTD
jgi:cell division protein FtsB